MAQLPNDSIPPLVDSLIQLSRSYTGDTEFDNAFASSKLAGEAAVDCCGEESTAYAAYCFNEGRIRYFQGLNKEALPWYIQARELRGQILGDDDIEYGKSCNNLAIAYDLLYRYEDAEPLYLEALTIREAQFGRVSAPAASVMANLGGMYSSMGEYEAAEPLLKEAVGIRKEILGKDHPQYAQSLVTLANYFYAISSYDNVEALLLEAKQIYEQQEYLDFYNYVNVLQSLGAYYQRTKALEQAEENYAKAANLVKDVLGEESPYYVTCVQYLSRLAYTAEDFEESANLCQQQMDILEELGYEKDHDYAIALQHLSRIYHEQGKLEPALEVLDQALEILEVTIGPHHQTALIAQWNKASLLQDLGSFEQAAATIRRITELEKKPLASSVRYLSDRQLSQFTSDYRDYLSQSLHLAAQYPQIADLCYDKLMLYKGFLLNNAILVRQAAKSNRESSAVYRRLRGVHRQLAQLYSQRNAEPAEVAILETAAEDLEKELVRSLSSEINLSFEQQWRDVQSQLAKSEASLEIVTYQTFRPSGRPIASFYAALLVLPELDRPIYIPLGSQASLNSLLQSSDGDDEGKIINELYSWDSRGEQLYEMTWQPIAKVLADYPEIKTIYISPDGLYNRLNLDAIPTSSDKVVAQAYKIRLLVSTRKLLEENEFASTGEATALLYGGISYGDTEIATNTSPTETTPSVGTRRAYTRIIRGYDPQNGYWQELPWTEVEINYANEVLQTAGYQTELKTAEGATETYLKESVANSSDSPKVIHLATHGYFFEPPATTDQQNLLPFEKSEESMIRSGLILADGNHAWTKGESRTPGTEDGILTALEVSQLELDETELVILSACETGLGEIQATEGVFGLRRAFNIAGARYIIMSLWQVPDYQTQAFMSSFYLAWLEENKSIPEAFRNAQAYMRARYKRPFEWAGFILLE